MEANLATIRGQQYEQYSENYSQINDCQHDVSQHLIRHSLHSGRIAYISKKAINKTKTYLLNWKMGRKNYAKRLTVVLLTNYSPEGRHEGNSWEMVCNWVIMTSSGDDTGLDRAEEVCVWSQTKLKRTRSFKKLKNRAFLNSFALTKTLRNI